MADGISRCARRRARLEHIAQNAHGGQRYHLTKQWDDLVITLYRWSRIVPSSDAGLWGSWRQKPWWFVIQRLHIFTLQLHVCVELGHNWDLHISHWVTGWLLAIQGIHHIPPLHISQEIPARPHTGCRQDRQCPMACLYIIQWPQSSSPHLHCWVWSGHTGSLQSGSGQVRIQSSHRRWNKLLLWQSLHILLCSTQAVLPHFPQATATHSFFKQTAFLQLLIWQLSTMPRQKIPLHCSHWAAQRSMHKRHWWMMQTTRACDQFSCAQLHWLSIVFAGDWVAKYSGLAIG